jgi:hypothetical protein
MHLGVSTLQRPVLLLEVSTPQRPVLLLEVSTSQGPELHLDVSTTNKSVLLLELSPGVVYTMHKGPELHPSTLQRPVRLMKVSTL